MDRLGVIAAVAGYVCWGFFPIYWKLLVHVSAVEILVHRIIWSFVFYFLLLQLTGRVRIQSIINQTRRDWTLTFFSGLILSLNWGLYIYAVNTGHILEGSLAYFINPLLNVAVGVFLFKEHIPRPLMIAVVVAGAGVLWRAIGADSFPWIALTLAATFCAYGVLKKRLIIKPQLSSVMESATVLLPAIAVAFWIRNHSELTLTSRDWMLLVLSGAVTGLPLYLFSFAVQRVPYSFMGMNQFIAPSLQFLVGYFIYNEAVSHAGWISFILIWAGVIIYLLYQFRQMKL